MSTSLEGGSKMTAGELRDTLRKLEVGGANAKGRGAGVLELFEMRDRVAEAVRDLQAQGLDLRPELGRIETVDGTLQRKATVLLRELHKAGGLAAARQRQASTPPREHWWWYLDETVAERRRKSILRTVITALIVIVVVGGGLYAVDRFTGLSPEEREAQNLAAQAESSLIEGNVDAAIADYERAVAVQPTFAEGYVYLSVLYEQKGRTQDAEDALAAARQIYGDETTTQEQLAQIYLNVGEYDRVVEVTAALIAQDPENVRAYYIRGGAYELTNELQMAADDLKKAAELAQAQGNDTLYVLAQTRYANLLQRLMSQQP